jgi:hypothetical protein
MRYRLRFVPTTGGIVVTRLNGQSTRMVDSLLFAWTLGEETGDPSYLDAFAGEEVQPHNGRRLTLCTDPAALRHAVDDLGLPVYQGSLDDPSPVRYVPTGVGIVTIAPLDRAELLLTDQYLAAVSRWHASGDARHLRPYVNRTIHSRAGRVYRLLTRPDALAELIARGLLAQPDDHQGWEGIERCQA